MDTLTQARIYYSLTFDNIQSLIYPVLTDFYIASHHDRGNYSLVTCSGRGDKRLMPRRRTTFQSPIGTFWHKTLQFPMLSDTGGLLQTFPHNTAIWHHFTAHLVSHSLHINHQLMAPYIILDTSGQKGSTDTAIFPSMHSCVCINYITPPKYNF